MFCRIILISLLFFSVSAFSSERVLNIYTWSSYIPHNVIQEFEHETGIKVNINEYDSNEVLYAKLKADPHAGYDLVFPSSYYVQRMREQGMLRKINFKVIPNAKSLNPGLMNKAFDPGNQYSVPYFWGTTGIAVDRRYWNPKHIQRWSDLWQKRFRNQLLMYDDPREVFAIAFIKLGYSINDTNPKHIRQAYFVLKKLLKNVRVFNSDATINIYADNDVTVGMAQNGDLWLAHQDNPYLTYIYPKDGFSLWIDCIAVPKYAPHYEAALQFINFFLRPDINKQIVLSQGFSTPDLAAMKLLPKSMRENPVFNPPVKVLKKAQLQTDIGDAVQLYQKYWQLLKLA